MSVIQSLAPTLRVLYLFGPQDTNKTYHQQCANRLMGAIVEHCSKTMKKLGLSLGTHHTTQYPSPLLSLVPSQYTLSKAACDLTGSRR